MKQEHKDLLDKLQIILTYFEKLQSDAKTADQYQEYTIAVNTIKSAMQILQLFFSIHLIFKVLT